MCYSDFYQSSKQCSFVQEYHLHPPFENLMWPSLTDSYQSHISVSYFWGPAVELWPISRALQLRDLAELVALFLLYVVDTCGCKCDWAGIETRLSIRVGNTVGFVEVEVAGSGRKHQNNKRMEGWHFWTVLDSPLPFSVLLPPQSFHHNPAKRAEVMMGPKLSQSASLTGPTLNGCLFPNISVSHHHPINPMPL